MLSRQRKGHQDETLARLPRSRIDRTCHYASSTATTRENASRATCVRQLPPRLQCVGEIVWPTCLIFRVWKESKRVSLGVFRACRVAGSVIGLHRCRALTPSRHRWTSRGRRLITSGLSRFPPPFRTQCGHKNRAGHEQCLIVSKSLIIVGLLVPAKGFEPLTP